MKILVDADSCPASVREVILKAAKRLEVFAVFAANRVIPGLWGNGLMELCAAYEGAADNRIAELAQIGDVAVTRDIPLARRLVEMSVYVVDDRGRVFTRDNIGEYYSIRCFHIDAIENGVNIIRRRSYNKRDLKSFADAFDKILQRTAVQPFCRG